MPRFLSPQALKAALADGDEIALLDVREHGQYGEEHLFFAIPLPYSRLEADIVRLVLRRGTRIVLYAGAASTVAAQAATRLAALGYRDIAVLDGGIEAWRAAGFAVYAGVNVPSKTFGELVEHAFATPHISAAELHERLARRDKLVVLDGRPPDEHRKMAIPGSVCCPNGELAYRWRELVDDPDATIVVHCAGRTRSIIGAQTLIDLGVPHPVYALENGTQGWTLAGLALERGSTRRYPAEVDESRLGPAREAAATLAARSEVPQVDAATVGAWLAEADRSTYLCDVRTAEEFAERSLAGAQHTPGGQLIQAADQYVAVRGARLVLYDGEGIRAPVVAGWLRRMGYDAVVLAGGLRSGLALSPAKAAVVGQNVPGLSVAAAQEQLLAGEAVLVDVRSSAAYRAGHIPGAIWSIRPRLAAQFAGERRAAILVADDPAIGELAAQEWRDTVGTPATLLAGGLAAWSNTGLPLEATEHEPPDAERIDYLFFVHDRHDGNLEAARRYLAWETNLVAQLDADERGTFSVGGRR